MSQPPTGTITLLFTDIEDSTRLLQRLGDHYPAILAAHQQLLRAAFERGSGYEVLTEGDSFFVAFERAGDAVGAAVAAQQALATHQWPDGIALRVRMALHTGEPSSTGDDYVGLDVHRAARLCAAGHGGQVLLSQTTHALVEHNLPAGVAARDLGTHRLKDLLRPERIFQLVIANLPDAFPPLKTLDAGLTNLPVQATALIGRERDIATARMLLRREDLRLLTLTGPGGTGKTRLALQVAAELLDTFADGVYFVTLAPINDPDLVTSTIVQTLGIREAGSLPLIERLKDHLRAKHMLLLLDNFEQVLQATSLVGQLLAAAPGLKILVTSRAALHLYGEREFLVPPLALPNVQQLPALDRLIQYDSVRLFIERAQAVKADFTVTNDNAPAVAEICVRLDGLPLAIELAAARSKLFPPQSLLARLNQRFKVLVGGAQDLPARQQTLRSAVDWSYNLLNAGEQALFRHLAVFVGGFTVDAAETVCGADAKLHMEVLDGLALLVDNSLLQQDAGLGGEPRILMLETIREYALELLTEHGEIAALQRQHATYYLALAETADPELRGAQMLRWLVRLKQEHDNLRAALTWYQMQDDSIEASIRLAGALWFFWFLQGLPTEGRSWLNGALVRLDRSEAAASVARAWAVGGAGMLAWIQGDWIDAQALGEKALFWAQQVGDRQIAADALYLLSQCAMGHGDLARALTLATESLALHRDGHDRFRLGMILLRLGWLYFQQGMVAQAQAYMDECYTVSRSVQNPFLHAGILGLFADLAARLGDDTRARVYSEESLELLRALGEHYNLTWRLFSLGDIARREHDEEQAGRWYREGLALAEKMGHKGGRANAMYHLGALARKQGDDARAQAWYEESLVLFQELGDQAGIAAVQTSLGFLALHQGIGAQAAACFAKSIALCQHLGDHVQIGMNLLGVAGVAIIGRQLPRAARLLGAADHQFETSNRRLDPADRTEYERIGDTLRAELDDVALATAQAAGRELPLEHAIDEALTESTTAEHISPHPPATLARAVSLTYPASLTEREVEILRLVARGLTDAQVAEQLIISPRTVQGHLRSIYSKLDVTSRTAATRFAIEHQLI